MDITKRKYFGITLLRLRNKYNESEGLTSRKIAEHLGISSVYLYDVEGGRRRAFAVPKILLLRNIFSDEEVVLLLLTKAKDEEEMVIPSRFASHVLIQKALKQWLELCAK